MPSGVIWLGLDEWSMVLKISDINYVAAAQDLQESIVDRWAQFINSQGAGTRTQVTVHNRVLDDADVAALIQKPATGDGYDEYRDDFNRIARAKLADASGNTVTEKYLTITVREDSRDKAESSLTRMQHEITAQLQAMEGCQAERLSRTELLRVLAHMVRPLELFHFDDDEFDEQKRLAAADYIAPWAINLLDKSGPMKISNATGDTYHSVLWVRDYPVWLSDRLITELTEIKCDLVASLHLEPYDQADGLGLVKRQIAELEMQTIAERKKAHKQGIGQDMIPESLTEALSEARELRTELSTSNQKVFSTVMVIAVSARTPELLEQHVKQVRTVIRKLSITAEELKYMQLDGFTTTLPVGRRQIPMRRTLTTSSAAIILPFTTQELFVPHGAWYGVNANSSNAVVGDRRRTKNGNGFVLGTSGSGKGVFAKMEMLNIFLSNPNDDIIILDPEREYEPVVTALGGTVVRIHAGSQHRVNPFDIDLDMPPDDEDPIMAKSDFILSMLESLIGGRRGLTPKQKSLVDRVTVDMYGRYAANRSIGMPTFTDLRAGLEHAGPAGEDLASALEIYTTGSLSGFSHHTNVDAQNRMVAWDISRLGAEMKTFGMMVVLDQIWNRVVRNRRAGKRTWLYIDEFHLLFSNPYAAAFFRSMYARARKWGLIPTGVTQNIEGVLANEDARIMLANCDFLALLGQNETDAASLVELLDLSPQQKQSFANVLPGQGLLRTDGKNIPFDARIPTSSKLYQLFDTQFGE